MDRKLYKLFFKAFSNNTRFEMIQLLRDGPRNVNEICRELKFEQSRVSHNLKCLENCGFVSFKWHGKYRIYSLDKEYIMPILKDIDKHLVKYGERLKYCGIIGNEKCDDNEEIPDYENKEKVNN